MNLGHLNFSFYLTANTTLLHYKDQPFHAVCCENHKKHTDTTLCEQNAEFCNVQGARTHRKNCTLRVQMSAFVFCEYAISPTSTKSSSYLHKCNSSTPVEAIFRTCLPFQFLSFFFFHSAFQNLCRDDYHLKTWQHRFRDL